MKVSKLCMHKICKTCKLGDISPSAGKFRLIMHGVQPKEIQKIFLFLRFITMDFFLLTMKLNSFTNLFSYL